MYPILDFTSCTCEDEKFSLAYDVFKNDFIHNKLYLDKIYINPQTCNKQNGKEKIFWHITTRKNAQNTREFDKERASRIGWIREIILNYRHQEIKMFYYREKNRNIRLYLWLYNHDFIVILQKLGKSESFLVTSFYIDIHYNKHTYNKRYEDYINKKDINLKDCEWF